MKKQTALLTTIAFLFTSASSGTITMPHAEETQTQQQTDVSAGLSIKALTAKAVDENPYMSNGDTNIHHDCYNTDTTDAVLPIGIYPEINVSFEKTNANASPAIFFDSYGHAIVPLLGGLAIRDLNAAQTQTIGYFSPTQHDGGGYVIASLGVDSGYVPYTCFSALGSYINEHPEIIQSFTNGLQKGLDYVNSHSSEEIAKIIQPQFEETDFDTLKTIVERYHSQDTWKTDTIFTEEAFELLQNILEEAGVLDKRVDYNALVTTQFSK